MFMAKKVLTVGLMLLLLTVSRTSAQQAPAPSPTTPGSMTVEERTVIAQGWALLAQGLLNDAQWARTRRAQLRADYLLAAEALVEYTFGCERYRDCIAMGTEIFDADESADGVVCWLLRAHHQLGEWGQANYVYRRYLVANRTDARRALDQGDAVAAVFAELSALRHVA